MLSEHINNANYMPPKNILKANLNAACNLQLSFVNSLEAELNMKYLTQFNENVLTSEGDS